MCTKGLWNAGKVKQMCFSVPWKFEFHIFHFVFVYSIKSLLLSLGEMILPVACNSWRIKQDKWYSSKTIIHIHCMRVSKYTHSSFLSAELMCYLSSWILISSGSWIPLEPEKGWTFCFASCSWKRSGQRSSPSRPASEISQETWRFSPQILSDPARDMLEIMKHFHKDISTVPKNDECE